jgi:multidrug efflux pump
MLVGLAAKNGILIVEFANQLRDEGKSVRDAVLASADTRLRPIIMTSITTAAGAVPLMLSSGAGTETRAVVGITLFFGVLFATVLTLYIVPTAYYILGRYTSSPNAIANRLREEMGGDN